MSFNIVACYVIMCSESSFLHLMVVFKNFKNDLKIMYVITVCGNYIHFKLPKITWNSLLRPNQARLKLKQTVCLSSKIRKKIVQKTVQFSENSSRILPCLVFLALGQLYVACSRAGEPIDLFVYVPDGRTKNVVGHHLIFILFYFQ